MNQNLYFKTDKFTSNKYAAFYFHEELSKEGLQLEFPQDEGFMYLIRSVIGVDVVLFYIGKNDEASTPALWQIWPEQQVRLLKRLFGKPNREAEEKAQIILGKIVSRIPGVSGIEWGG